MKAVVALAVFACVAAVVSASPRFNSGYGYGPELKPVYNGIAAPYNNARRQLTVNDRAEYKGTGTGTARYEGVPGSGNDFGYYRYNHGYDRGYNRGYGGYDGYDYGYGRY